MNDEYSDQNYEDIEKQAEYLLSFTDDSQSNLEKFLTIYTMLGKSIYYDNYFDERGRKKPAKWPGNQNLEGALLEGVTVCAGFSKALCYLADKLGIECKYVSGELPNGGLHAWNQVKIDGDWYNCDLTWDIQNIIDKKDLELFLRGKNDSEFGSRRIIESRSHKDLQDVSDRDFSQSEIMDARRKVQERLESRKYVLNFPRLKEREELTLLCTKGATRQQIIDYKVSMGYSTNPEEKEIIWEKFEALRQKNKHELRKKAQKVEVSGNLGEVIEYIMHCRERGLLVYAEWKGHRIYSTDYDLNPNMAYIQVMGMTKEEHIEISNDLIFAESEEEKSAAIKKSDELIRKNLIALKKREQENRELLRKYYPDTFEEISKNSEKGENEEER